MKSHNATIKQKKNDYSKIGCGSGGQFNYDENTKVVTMTFGHGINRLINCIKDLFGRCYNISFA